MSESKFTASFFYCLFGCLFGYLDVLLYIYCHLLNQLFLSTGYQKNMQLTVTCDDEIYTINASDELEFENFKALLEFECGVATSAMKLYKDSKLLHGDKESIASLGMKNGDVLLLVRNQPILPAQPRSQQLANQPSPQQSGMESSYI